MEHDSDVTEFDEANESEGTTRELADEPETKKDSESPYLERELSYFDSMVAKRIREGVSIMDSDIDKTVASRWIREMISNRDKTMGAASCRLADEPEMDGRDGSSLELD